MHTFLRFVLWALIIYLGYCGLLFLLQRRMMFPKPLLTPSDGTPPAGSLEQVWLKTPHGRIESWFLPARGEGAARPAPAVIFAHGNAELIDFCVDEFSLFPVLGIGLMLVEFPGYGRSSGSPSQKSITAAFEAAYDHLLSRKDVDTDRIVFFGRSMGGGAVCRLAASRPPAALILMSTFKSARSFAGRYLVPPMLVRDAFDNLSVVKNYTGPLLIIHGRYDRIIPYAHGVSLHRAAAASQLVTYDCRHNDCPPDRGRFQRDIEAFLKKAGILPR